MRRLAYLVAAGWLWSLSALAFANVPIGTEIENVSLPSFEGVAEPLLSNTNVSVFIFINPELEHSNQALAAISKLANDMADKPVHWCAIVSDRIPKATVQAEIKSIGLAMPVIIDEGDALYAKFGVVLHPVVGITDQSRKLVAYQHFTKVNYTTVIQAQIRHALKEINDDELALVLKPAAATIDEAYSVSHRYFRLAGKQFQATNYNQALTNIQKSLDQKPTAAAHVLRGQILAAQGKRDEAIEAFQAALKLDPAEPTALEEIKSFKQSGQ